MSDAQRPDLRPSTDAVRALLASVGERAAIGRALAGDAETSLLQSVVDAAAALFDSEAASIALFERDPDRLEYRVAAGSQGSGVVGLSVAPTQGIAGYVFSTGQPIALSDVRSDPRFDQAAAQRTGYVPRSIAAVPLVDDGATVGVLQVLDKRSTPTFTLRDMELLGVFARQAAAAIEASRVQRDTARLLADVLRRLTGDALDAGAMEELVADATTGLDLHEDDRSWELVELLAELRGGLGERELGLVIDILRVVARSGGAVGRGSGRG
jgi:GAF domain-containing protein